MCSLPPNYLTPEEYLAIERQAEFKSEYYAGETFSMAGATRRHVLITGNTLIAVGVQLRGRGCEVYSSGMRVLIEESGLYTYPDAVVICGERRFLDDREDTLINPTVLIEVLSESTEAYDRGRKWGHYQRLPSLRDYLLISQDAPRIEQFSRQGETDQWIFRSYDGLDAVIDLASIDCKLPLAEVFERVEFEATSETTNSPEG